MKYQISVRKTKEDEIISKECFMCDTDEETYAIHLSALVQDIAEKAIVQSISEVDNVIIIETSLSQEDLMGSLKELFTREFCYIRYLNINKT